MDCCKYCEKPHQDCDDEGLQCSTCSKFVHIRCLKRGAVPGGMQGDVFFTYTCQECSESNTEVFVRDKLSWLQAIVLVLYHLSKKSPGLAKKGFFHWKYQIASYIDKNWDDLFTKYVKRKKSWTGTVAGTLSHFSKYFFLSGTSIIKQPAWWTLKYPKLSPYMISKIYNSLMAQKVKSKTEKQTVSELEIFNQILEQNVKNQDMLQTFVVTDFDIQEDTEISSDGMDILTPSQIERNMKEKDNRDNGKRKSLLPTIDNKKFLKLSNSPESLPDDFTRTSVESQDKKQLEDIMRHNTEVKKDNNKLLDPFCHYNTSFSSIARMKGICLRSKILGGVRKESILSPYSGIHLQPYIRRDTEFNNPLWLTMLNELQLEVNENNSSFCLPPKEPLDYVYVQPDHIPAINSLCNQFFWAGIDLTGTLQYPEFSCVVLYKHLIVGFAFIVPNVSHTENYISFIFTRPGWRGIGIGTFMMYHLIQTSCGKDILLHVSINNPAFFLYQKFGFKVEKIVYNFYETYLRDDVKESKHAFLCRYER